MLVMGVGAEVGPITMGMAMTMGRPATNRRSTEVTVLGIAPEAVPGCRQQATKGLLAKAKSGPRPRARRRRETPCEAVGDGANGDRIR